MLENVVVREMNLEDLESIKDILTFDFDDFWDYNILKDELKSPNSKYIIVKTNDGEIIGFAGIKVLVDTASTSYISNKDKIELWDVEPYEAEKKNPRWIWYVETQKEMLLYPIIQPCNCNWNLRWSRDGVVLKEEKVKYFTNDDYELFHSDFLYIDKLIDMEVQL